VKDARKIRELQEEMKKQFPVSNAIAKFIATVLVFVLGVLFFATAWTMISASIRATDFNTYQTGVEEIWNFTAPFVHRVIPDLVNGTGDVEQVLMHKGIEIARQYSGYIESGGLGLVSIVSGSITQGAFFLVYFLLWCSAPISGHNADDLVKVVGTYVVLKTFCNMVYAAFVAAVLWFLHVDLIVVMSFLSFLLAYIPEVGAIIAVILPLPLVLFDSRHAPEQRLARGGLVFVAMFLIKIIVSNGLETCVMGGNKVLAGGLARARSKGEKEESIEESYEETHPVIVLVAVMIGAQVWDVTGMIISVPVIALLRTFYTRATAMPDDEPRLHSD